MTSTKKQSNNYCDPRGVLVAHQNLISVWPCRYDTRTPAEELMLGLTAGPMARLPPGLTAEVVVEQVTELKLDSVKIRLTTQAVVSGNLFEYPTL